MKGPVQKLALEALKSGPMTCKQLAAIAGGSHQNMATLMKRYREQGLVRIAEGSRNWGALWELVDQEQLAIANARKLLEDLGFTVTKREEGEEGEEVRAEREAPVGPELSPARAFAQNEAGR